MEPYEDPRLPADERVADLLPRMTLAEKAALMCHGRLFTARHDTFPEECAAPADAGVSHFLLMTMPEPAVMARWNNHLQDQAAATRLGIPVTLSSDPRHGFAANAAVAHLSGGFSRGPEPIGLAATDDPGLVAEFAAAAARELRAVGIRVAVHPMADLATEPRWARIHGTFGEDAGLASRMLAAYIGGFQGDRLGPDSVACMVKHFPGGGATAAGEDPHFSYGRFAAYPGGNLEYHLRPFEAALEAGCAQVMPGYGIPVGTGMAEVGACFNRDVVAGLLRGRYRFDGVVCTDFNLLAGMAIPGRGALPARNWGVEHLPLEEQVRMLLDADVDQFGGETRPELIVDAVRSGAVTESRIDASVRRILRDKFLLGLFDDPYVDPDAAAELVGDAATRALGRTVQRRSLVRLSGTPLGYEADCALYVENIDPQVASRYGKVVDRPEDADLAVVRVDAPYEHREGLLEAAFRAGSLEFPPGETARLNRLGATVPLALCVHLDRPAVLTGVADTALLLLADFGAEDDLVLDAVFGRAEAEGRLPFDLPSSMRAVEESREDVPFDTADPLFRFGHPANPHISEGPEGEGS
ncbi:glycoside hydrolase family 3 N-terminal domain-containing protein [Yinghuangia seranimata]|nr:glycoside hydrolase family 3 N-terminal domain-containing protein [Yinghuangia seranimata]MDI2125674.1 glycoside hydrolase family 3 N-terminal domain-containing protein [Yinghuangia seranimata]